MTISTKVKNNLIDIVIVIAITVVSIYLSIIIADWFIRLSPTSFVFGHMFTFIYLMVTTDVLPSILIGLLQGTITALFIRNRHLTIALLPSMFLFVFEVIIFSFSSVPSNLRGFLFLNTFYIISWLGLIISAFLSARWVLKCRG